MSTKPNIDLEEATKSKSRSEEKNESKSEPEDNKDTESESTTQSKTKSAIEPSMSENSIPIIQNNSTICNPEEAYTDDFGNSFDFAELEHILNLK